MISKHEADYAEFVWPVDRTKVFCTCGWTYLFKTGDLDPEKVGSQHIRRAERGAYG